MNSQEYKEKACEIFKNDLFATQTTGIEIEEVGKDYAKCSLKIDDRHRNANGLAMGGAIFTLADFAFAIASNIETYNAVSLSSTIEYMRAVGDGTIYAEARCRKDGRRVCFYEIVVSDENGKTIAVVSSSGFRS